MYPFSPSPRYSRISSPRFRRRHAPLRRTLALPRAGSPRRRAYSPTETTRDAQTQVARTVETVPGDIGASGVGTVRGGGARERVVCYW